MIEICSDSIKDDKVVQVAEEILKRYNINVKTVYKRDNYSITRWSIDDLVDIENIKDLTCEEKIKFLEYAERVLHENMIERGWDSLKDLAYDYIKEKEKASA